MRILLAVVEPTAESSDFGLQIFGAVVASVFLTALVVSLAAAVINRSDTIRRLEKEIKRLTGADK
jgi:hypothetical protein